MLSEDQYQWVKPGEDFSFHGQPLPASDLAGVQRAPTREDLAYLQEWETDCWDVLQYGVPGYTKTYVLNSKFLSSQVMSRDEVSQLAMNRRHLFSTPGSPGTGTSMKALSNYTYLTSVYFTSAGELSSAVAPYTSWTLQPASAVLDAISPELTFYTEVSSLCAQLSSPWAKQSTAAADPMRALYYDFGRLSALGQCCQSYFADAIKSYSKDFDLKTNVPSDWTIYSPGRYACLASLSGTCKYWHKRWDSSSKKFVETEIQCLNSSTGSPLKGVNLACQQQLLSGEPYFYYRGQSEGDFGVSFSPALSGRIAEAYVLWNCYMSHSATGSSYQSVYMTKVEKLAQASPVNGKETWACTEGTFKDMGALGTELFKLAGASQHWAFFRFYQPCVLLKLKDRDSKQFKIEGWDWTPSGGFSKRS